MSNHVCTNTQHPSDLVTLLTDSKRKKLSGKIVPRLKSVGTCKFDLTRSYKSQRPHIHVGGKRPKGRNVTMLQVRLIAYLHARFQHISNKVMLRLNGSHPPCAHFEASHVCGNAWCVSPAHGVWETAWDNVARNACLDEKYAGHYSTCPHQPKCQPQLRLSKQAKQQLLAEAQQIQVARKASNDAQESESN